jgi:hypothetical protein
MGDERHRITRLIGFFRSNAARGIPPDMMSSAYAGYAKRTIERALSATRKRHAHRLANPAGTEFRNETRNRFRNDDTKCNDTPIKAMKGR